MGWLKCDEVSRIRALFEHACLPIESPALGTDKYLQLMSLDKKVQEGKIRFVLLKAIGQAVVSEVPADLLRQTLDSIHA
jgi:3-dehydroquinate synthetase